MELKYQRFKRAYELRKGWLLYLRTNRHGCAKAQALIALSVFDARFNYGHQVQKYYRAARRWRESGYQ